MLIGFFNCQKENLSIDIEQDLKTQTSTTKTVSARDIPEVMSFIASKSPDYKFVLDDSKTSDGMNRSHEDNVVMTELITDEITQVTNAYQKSNYTFKLIKQNGLAVGNIEDAHHEQMAVTFIEIIGSALDEYDNNQQEISYYYYLAWGALFETDAWNTAVDFYDYEEDPYSIIDAIIIANNQEDTNGLDAVGSPCP